MKSKFLCLIFLVGFAFGTGGANATTHEFYKGKAVRIVVGLPAGDVYDLWARLIAVHMRGYSQSLRATQVRLHRDWIAILLHPQAH